MAAPGTKMMLSLAATLMHNSYALQTSPALVRLLRTQPRVSPATLQVVPAELLQEQLALEESLSRSSRVDGMHRLKLSESQLPFAVAQHAIEPELPVFAAHARSVTGKNAAKWLRQAERMPARIHSLPGGRHLLIHMAARDAERMVRTYGRNGCQARAFRLDILDPQEPQQTLASVRVKPAAVRMNAATQRMEDIDFIYCPQERRVQVDVPVRLLNEESAPGVKKGGWMWMKRRTIRYKALGSSLPPFLELNVRALELDQALRVRDLPLPPGAALCEADLNQEVVLCTTDVGKD